MKNKVKRSEIKEMKRTTLRHQLMAKTNAKQKARNSAPPCQKTHLITLQRRIIIPVILSALQTKLRRVHILRMPRKLAERLFVRRARFGEKYGRVLARGDAAKERRQRRSMRGESVCRGRDMW
jgi:hypothetical protein